jgi:hypothetical protein
LRKEDKKGGMTSTTLGIKNVSLDKWGAVHITRQFARLTKKRP